MLATVEVSVIYETKLSDESVFRNYSFSSFSEFLASFKNYVHTNLQLVGGFNPSEKYESKRKSSPNRGEHKKYLKPPPSCRGEKKTYLKAPPRQPLTCLCNCKKKHKRMRVPISLNYNFSSDLYNHMYKNTNLVTCYLAECLPGVFVSKWLQGWSNLY